MAEYHSQIPVGRINPDTQQVDYQCYGDAEPGRDRDGNPVCKKKRLAKSSGGWNWTAIVISLVVILLLILAVLSISRPGWHRRFFFRRARPAIVLR